MTYAPPTAPRTGDAAVQQARVNQRARQQQAAGAASTILTGGQGVTGAGTTRDAKTLLGA